MKASHLNLMKAMGIYLAISTSLLLMGCEFVVGQGKKNLPKKADDADEVEAVNDVDNDENKVDAADIADEDEAEIILTGCGNGTVDEGEACDDGNNVTEYCGGLGDCLGDCSVRIVDCGNGTIDDGEECDGDENCTTSCIVNDHDIGAPCTCPTTATTWCSEEDGVITGCENVEVPEGSGGLLGCMRSYQEPTIDYRMYYAEGYCTIMAAACEGEPCGMLDLPGDVETFDRCPDGTYLYQYTVYVEILDVVLTMKHCSKRCTSPAQCRWNAYDNFWGNCGDYDCLQVPGDSETHVCENASNFF